MQEELDDSTTSLVGICEYVTLASDQEVLTAARRLHRARINIDRHVADWLRKTTAIEIVKALQG